MYRCLVIALALTGCAWSVSSFARPADVYHPVDYPLWHDALFAELFWRCVPPAGGEVRVEGYAVSSMRNERGLLNFEVRLIARDAKGNTLANRWTYGDRLNADQFDPVPFEISVPVAGKGVRYDLYYNFTVPDRSDRLGQTQFGTIEDVCGGRWRLREIPPTS